MLRNAKNSKSGPSKNRSLTMGIYFIDPDDGESEDIMKNARRKLEVPMPAAMPCKLQREKYRET